MLDLQRGYFSGKGGLKLSSKEGYEAPNRGSISFMANVV